MSQSNRNLILAIFGIIVFFFVALNFLGTFQNESEYRINEYQVVLDNDIPLEALNWNTISKQRSPSNVNPGFVDQEFLVGISLQDYSDIEGEVFLEFDQPSLRKVEMYTVADDGSLRLQDKSGTGVKGRTTIKNPNPTFQFPLSILGESKELVFNVQTFTPADFSITLFPEENFFNNYSRSLLAVSTYLGIMLALFLYNLILYFSVKDKLYFYYCFYIFFIGLAQISLSGHSYYFFLGENAYLYELSIVAFTSFSSVFVIPFIRLFLKTGEYLPKVDKWLNLIIVSYLAALVVYIAGAAEISYMIIDLNGMVLAVTFFSTGIYIASKGSRSAMYFLVAWGFFLFGLVLYILHNQGIIHMGAYANLPMLVGTAMEAILLSFALADKINLLKQEKEKEQNEKVAALRENERLIKEQNVYLEKMVLSRTEELEHALKNLQNTQTQLVNQEKMASLGQLTAGIAHEINNPINFVSSNISPLRRDINDILEMIALYREKGEEEFSAESKKELKNFEEDIELDYLLVEVDQLLQGIDDGARRTVEIVRGLRLFSRVDEQDVKKVDLHDGLDSTLILLNSSMQGKIKVTKQYGELPLVECLAGKINQVFMNVINNAIHALLDPSHAIENPEIIIRTSLMGEEVRIEIQDNGVGMPDHVKEKVFEPFFTTKEVGKGTGLGLSIVYTVIENHKGRLEIYSKVNEGTNFVIILPVNQQTVSKHEG
ncbi:MAG TPA: 7TM diverse intracellular signaling domain-containing protein [Cyclobacteriaceae bacterium]|nr:7TM diverse intracellular signaling domain-containing protein [Cyclobacteriaceae bacterium]